MSNSKLAALCWIGIFAGFLLGYSPVTAQSTATAMVRPAQLAIIGAWSGRGTMTWPGGKKESAKCEATFSRFSDAMVRMQASCTVGSDSFSQEAKLRHVAGERYTGSFHNPDYNIRGSLEMTVVDGNKLNAFGEGAGGSLQAVLSRK